MGKIDCGLALRVRWHRLVLRASRPECQAGDVVVQTTNSSDASAPPGDSLLRLIQRRGQKIDVNQICHADKGRDQANHI